MPYQSVPKQTSIQVGVDDLRGNVLFLLKDLVLS